MTGMNWFVSPKTGEICLTRKDAKLECSEGEFLALLQEVCGHFGLSLVRAEAPVQPDVKAPQKVAPRALPDELEDAEVVEDVEDSPEGEEDAPQPVSAAKQVLDRLDADKSKKRTLRV